MFAHHEYCILWGSTFYAALASASALVRDAVHHIIRESRRYAHRERTCFLPSPAPWGRGGREDIVISDAAADHTLVDIVVSDPTRRDFVERVARQDLVAATNAKCGQETDYRDCS